MILARGVGRHLGSRRLVQMAQQGCHVRDNHAAKDQSERCHGQDPRPSALGTRIRRALLAGRAGTLILLRFAGK